MNTLYMKKQESGPGSAFNQQPFRTYIHIWGGCEGINEGEVDYIDAHFASKKQTTLLLPGMVLSRKKPRKPPTNMCVDSRT